MGFPTSVISEDYFRTDSAIRILRLLRNLKNNAKDVKDILLENISL